VNVNVIKYMPQKCQKMTDLWLSGVFFQAPNTSKLVFGRGSAPDPRWGSLRRSPRPPSRLGRGTPPPHTLPPSTPSASRSRRLRRLGCQAPPNANSWLRLWPTHTKSYIKKRHEMCSDCPNISCCRR